nr:hypothetical protein [Tanacetum cinerariifolium]
MVTETLVNIDSSTKRSSSISNKRVAAAFYIIGLEAVDKAMGQLARLTLGGRSQETTLLQLNTKITALSQSPLHYVS